MGFIKPHKMLGGKALQYWAKHGKHVKAELVPNPAAIVAGIPAALSNTVGFVSGGFLKMSVKEFLLPVWSPPKFSFGSVSEKSSEKRRLSDTTSEPMENRWVPLLISSHSQNQSLNPTSCANFNEKMNIALVNNLLNKQLN